MIPSLLRKFSLCASLVLLIGGVTKVQAQQTSPFTVLSNNADMVNKRLYVEIMYQQSACGRYKAMFRLKTPSNPDGSEIAYLAILNNEGTYEEDPAKLSLIDPKAGGYRLVFDIEGYEPDDSVEICVDAYRVAYVCNGCAAGGSTAIFGTQDIAKDCPYKGSDVIACYQRAGNPWATTSPYNNAAGNWEAWIQDPRDCEAYRIIQNADGSWWFAQNLNFQKDLMYRKIDEGTLNGVGARGEFWCPNGRTIMNNDRKSIAMKGDSIDNQTTLSSDSSAVLCKTYGALYSWTTAMSLNGRTYTADVSVPTSAGSNSVSQGICPDGWLLPSDKDWGVMLNYAEDDCRSEDPDGNNTVAPCNHNRNDLSAMGSFGTPRSMSVLRATYSCRPHAARVDSVCASLNNPAWAWRRADYAGKISAPLALGIDKYGFGMLPSGYRNATSYRDLGWSAAFWSSTQSTDTIAAARIMSADSLAVRALHPKSLAMSIRCIAALPVVRVANWAYDFEPYVDLTVMRLAEPATYTYEWSFSGEARSAIKQPVAGDGTAEAVHVQAELQNHASYFDKMVSATVVATSTRDTSIHHAASTGFTVLKYDPNFTISDTLICRFDTVNLVARELPQKSFAYTFTWNVVDELGAPDEDGSLSFTKNGVVDAYQTTIKNSSPNVTGDKVYSISYTVTSLVTGATVTSPVKKLALVRRTPGYIGDTAGEVCTILDPGRIE